MKASIDLKNIIHVLSVR